MISTLKGRYSAEKGGPLNPESIKDDVAAELMELPNVVGVGTGEEAGRQIIKVYVETKVPEAELRPEDVVPKTLDGEPTDVEEIGVVTAQAQEER